MIDEPQSAVVRRMFELYASGEGLRSIAHRLNAESVPSPRRKGWASAAVQVMLKNPIYRGEMVWNRSEWIKDHETGKRRRFERPEVEWIRREAPDLAIVSRDLWESVQAVKYRRRSVYVTKPGGGLVTTRAGAGHRSRGRYLFSGLLECAQCRGSFFDLHGTGFLGCGWHRDRGPEVCASSLRVPASALEERVLGTVRERVLVPDVAAYAVQRALETFSDGMDQEPNLRARLEKIDAELGNLERFAAKTGRVDEAADLFAELEAEREGLHAQLGAALVTSIDAETLRAMAEERVLELRRALDLSPDRGRSLFLSLLGDRRMRVGADPEHGFRVEGVFDLGLEIRPTRGREGFRAGRAFGSGWALRVRLRNPKRSIALRSGASGRGVKADTAQPFTSLS